MGPPLRLGREDNHDNRGSPQRPFVVLDSPAMKGDTSHEHDSGRESGMTPPYISAKEAARLTGLTLSDLAALRWGRRHGQPDVLTFTFLSAAKSAAPFYDEASVEAFIEARESVSGNPASKVAA